MPIAHDRRSPASPCFLDDFSHAVRLPAPKCDALFRALIDAGSDLAELSAELSPYRTLAYTYSLPPGLVGAYVPVRGRETEFQVGLVSDVCSCDKLAQVVARARAQGELDVAVALTELAAALTLRFRRRAAPSLDLFAGVPVFVDGIGRRARAARVRAATVMFGTLRVTLTLSERDAVRESDWPAG